MTYDPKLNIAICRSRGLWVYRYKGGCPADAFRAEWRHRIEDFAS
jgi:hypothetical protein